MTITTRPQLDALEDFAGPGGWDEGARLLGSPLRILGREINADAVETARAAGHLRKHCSVLDDDPAQYGEGLALYIASPPCQTFSTAGKGAGRDALQHLLAAARLVWEGMLPVQAVAAVHDEALDERSVLVLEPLRVIRTIKPLTIAMEQVPNALPVFQLIADILNENGYHARAGVVSAEEYGVPQTRKRCILTAVRADLADEAPWPTKTHSKYYPRNPQKVDAGYPAPVSMAAALGWGEEELVGFPRKADSDDIVTLDGEDYRARDFREGGQPSFAVSGKARSWKRYGWDGKVATHMGDVVRKNGTVRSMEQPSATITGALDNGNFKFIEVNEDRFNDQSGTAFDPLWPTTRPATAVAGRGLVQNPGATANRFNGSTKSRNDGVKITVQEAGLLQSFPANYPWQGTMTSQFQRVGDAVPPVLAAAILAPLLALI